MPPEDLKNRVLQSPNNLIWAVKDLQEVSCPLGGVSVEYILEINTSRCEFKTTMQSESAIINFNISKTFKEVEYFYNKLKSQHQVLSFPDFFKNEKMYMLKSDEYKCNILNKVLEFIAGQQILVTSPTFLDFLGYDVNRQAHETKTAPVKISPKNSEKVLDDADRRKANISQKELPSQSQSFYSNKENINESKKRSFEAKSHINASEDLFGKEDDDDEMDDDLFEADRLKNKSEQFPHSHTSSSLHESDEHLLFERQELGGAIFKHDHLGFEPLYANSSVDQVDKLANSLDVTDLLRVDDSLSDILNEFTKPPKKPVIKSKPTIKPKPNLSSSSKEKPMVSPRPQSLAAAAVSKPVPPPRTSCAKSPTTTSEMKSTTNKETASSTTRISDEIDILDYINKETNAQNQNLELF